MAWPPDKFIQILINEAKQKLRSVHIIEHSINAQRGIIDLEGQWLTYRIIVQEIHRPNGQIRYTYYVLNQSQQVVHGFDNSPDRFAIQLRYGKDWKLYQHSEVPHYHDATGQVSLTEHPMTFDLFMTWLKVNLE